MVGLERLTVSWHSGYVEVHLGEEGLEISGANFAIELGAREIAFRGPFEGLREVEGWGQEKIVYVDFAFTLKGFKKSGGARIVERNIDASLGAYGVSYTRLKGGLIDLFYLTIYAPPGSLYDRVVVSGDKLALFTVKRRKVYMMQEDGLRRIYMV